MKPEFLLSLKGFKSNKAVFVIIVLALMMGTTNYIAGDALLGGVEDFLYQVFVKLYRGDLVIKTKETAQFIEDVESKVEKIDTLEGVDGASPRLEVFGKLRKGDKERELYIFGFIPSKEAKVTEFDQTVIEGDFLDDGDKEKVMIGKALASDFDIEIGDVVELVYRNDVVREYKVAGIYQTGGNYDTHAVFMNIDMLQKDLSLRDVANWVLISLKKGYSAEQYKILIYKLGIGDDVRTTEEEFPGFVRTVNIVTDIVRLLVILSLVIGALMETTLFYVIIISNKKEIAILKAIGTRKSVIVLVYVIQGLIYGLIASILGIVLGYCIVSSFESHPFFIESVGTFFTIKFRISSAIIAAMVTTLVGVFASFYPAYKATKIDIVEVVRT